MLYGITYGITRQSTVVRIPPLLPAEAGTRLSDNGRMQGWLRGTVVERRSVTGERSLSRLSYA